ncbi:HAD-IIB family hydrolase [Spectribacter hydrogenoxidans]|uniref:HAD-IIB family hydrolase n=1 Tax=Spectribacter hydrogenoxidans TaxID=3075608 RepID=A0ABU3BWD0_9GAMM|nr:HAD-IIB family hydrolase [Salinisphaera sp. W335]MDT0633603.1 HAD-IIB family hydrolase [Salinisphaera sp. W335]
MTTRMTPGPPVAVIYTDLDGTLLSHDGYDWRSATAALSAAADRGVPVVPITSKTRAEMGPVRAELGLVTPYAVENGGAIVLAGPAPEETVLTLGPAYAEICRLLVRLRARGWRFSGFADLGPIAVAEATGLDPAAAERACDRLCSEPLIWQDTDAALHDFRAVLAGHGLTTRRGGRFLHVMGRCDKGAALRRLQAHIGAGTTPASLALGDSPNDFDMLAAADRGVLVARPDGSYAAPPDPPGLIHAPGIGPAGWNAAVLDWLADNVNGEC